MASQSWTRLCGGIHLGAKIWDPNHDNLVSIWWFDTFFDYLFDSVFFRVELHH